MESQAPTNGRCVTTRIQQDSKDECLMCIYTFKM